MQLSPYIFRGYDIRGVSGQDIDENIIYLIGRGYATWLAERGVLTCSVGRDSRATSFKYSASFIRGLNDGGIDTIDLGLSLSQIVYFSSYYFLTKACAMVTASHNPKQYNGLKLGIGYSETMSAPDIQTLQQIVSAGRFSIGYGSNKRFDLFPAYLKNLLKHFRLRKKWHIVVDTLNSSAGKFYPTIFRRAGCRVRAANQKLDNQFPHGTDPTDTQVLNRLSREVINHKADLGFAFDPDGDRMAVVDELGQIHWMDSVVAIFAADILERVPGSTIIYNNLCSKSLTNTISRLGGHGIMWKTGHSYIKDKIRETKSLLGGELSGHIFFGDNYFGHDDAAYASLRLLTFLERHQETLSQAMSSVENFIGSPEIKLGVSDQTKFFLVNKIKHDLTTAWPDATVNELDGVRLDTDQLMVVVRASQNGPYITVRFEANTQKLYNETRSQLKKILTNYQDINWSDNVNGSALAQDHATS